MTKTILVNKNTVLKQIELSDTADIFNTIVSQREYLEEWLPFALTTEEMSDSESFIRSVVDAPEDEREFVSVIHYDGEFAGLVGFKSTDRDNKKTEIGYWLSEGFQKKGIMTESVKCLIRFAFEELNINRIQIKCAVGNTPSSKSRKSWDSSLRESKERVNFSRTEHLKILKFTVC